MLAPGLATAAIVAVALATSPAASAGTRDPLVQPFSAASPWNTPLGDRAQYQPAGLGNGPVGIESVLVAPAPADASTGSVVRRTCAVPGTGWLVLVDADALAATSYRCSGGSTRVRLTGTGMPAGSAATLFAPGGAVAAAELSGERPLRHALALTVPGTQLRAGTLLALPPSLAGGVRTRTAAGRRLLAALRDYGAYVTATRTSAVRIRLRNDAQPEGGFTRPVLDPGTRADLATMVGELAVVTNNGPGAVGGPGRRRVVAAPALAAVPAASPPAHASPRSTATTTAPAPAPVAVAARPIVETTPRDAPGLVLWGLAALAVVLLAIGLRAGRSLAGGR